MRARRIVIIFNHSAFELGGIILVNPYVNPNFIGRENQLSWLQQQLTRVIEGEPQFIIVQGESGIGKTRILDEFTKRTGKIAFVVLMTAGGFFGAKPLYQQLLLEIQKTGESLLKAVSKRIETSVEYKLNFEHILDVLKNLDVKERLRSLVEKHGEKTIGVAVNVLKSMPFSPILPLLSGLTAEVKGREKEKETLKYVFFEALKKIDEKIRKKDTALVIVIDQWERIESLSQSQTLAAKALLGEVIDRAKREQHKILLILSVKEGRMGSSVGGELGVKFNRFLVLEPLTEKEARMLVCRPISPASAELKYEDEVVGEIVDRSRRNPFYILYICQMLYNEALEKTVEIVNMDLFSKVIPETLEQLFGVRLKELLHNSVNESETARFLKHAAFRPFDVFTRGEIAKETGIPAKRLTEIIKLLKKHQFLKCVKNAYTFFHPLIRNHLQIHYEERNWESKVRINLYEKILEIYREEGRRLERIPILEELYRETLKTNETEENEYYLSCIVEALKEGHFPKESREAAFALGNLRDRRAVPALTEALREENPKDKYSILPREAAWALGKMGEKAWSLEKTEKEWVDERTIPALVEALEHVSPEVRCASIWALVKMRAKETVPTLIEMLEDANPKVRKKVIWALKRMSHLRARACPICGKKTRDLLSHIKNVHGENWLKREEVVRLMKGV